ncbi:hypothetical protein SAMN05444167_0525 [Terriglobus roseus]|uniref:Uncharacterized protein n=1 Tax=Terriglobus roseus TaxID=392734 RepID=A0A1G7G1V6_9BACT|nr:hypothetical protein SAMN05444167_0525 [Terriglobus roseus]
MIARRTIVLPLLLLPLLSIESNAQLRHKPSKAKTLDYLSTKAGLGPWDIWKTQPLRNRLIALLGSEQFQTLQMNMDPADPLKTSNGVMSSGGNRAHLGGEEEGVLLLDLNDDVIEVLILNRGGVVRAWAEHNSSVPIPPTIRERLNQWPQAALHQALASLNHQADPISNPK